MTRVAVNPPSSAAAPAADRPRESDRPVVVGVDGSPQAHRAVGWAAAEAARRGRPLRILSVQPAHGVHSAFVLTDATDEAHRIVPELPVSGTLRDGDPVAALLEAARGAELLVVGNRGLRALTGLLLGTVSAAVAARAACPTVVVRGSTLSLPDEPVVVGLDGTPASEAAIGYAFAAADREDVPLIAVHAWRDTLDDPDWPSVLDPGDSDDAPEAELVAERLAGWCGRYPDVEVVREIGPGRAATVLVQYSGRARLLVLGSRRREHLAGSVGCAVLRAAHCPVAVVPPGPR